MPNVPKHGQFKQHALDEKTEMEKMHRDDRARDDIKGAYAGEENENTSAHAPHGEHHHDTKLKARKTLKSRDRTKKV